MFIVTRVEDGLTTVVPARTWADVIPLLKVKDCIRRLSVKEDGKFILLVRRYHVAHHPLHDLPSGRCDEQKT